MERLTRLQYGRLDDIMEYTTMRRPNIGWMGHKKESRHLSKEQWTTKLSLFLYRTYNDLYNTEPISREAIDDYFDDAYVDNLLSVKAIICSFIEQCWPKKRYIEEEHLLQI